MPLPRDTEVLVVGAGPVGLYAALAIAEKGIPVQIIDEEWRTAAHSYALALHPRSLSLLGRFDLVPELLQHALRVEMVGLYDGFDRKAELSVARIGGDYPYLAVLPQSGLESLLEKSLALRGIRVHWNHQASKLVARDDHVATTVHELGKASSGYAVASTEWRIERTSRIRSRYVIGADGHRSLVRRMADIQYRQVGPAQLFAVFEFGIKGDTGREVRLVLDGDTTNAVWPLPGARWRWSFELADADPVYDPRRKSRIAVQVGARAYPMLTTEALHAMLSQRAAWFSGRPTDIDWSLVVRFERRLAECMGRGRFWLAGDSAHMTGPAGMQSMNAGLQEADDLADRIARSLKGESAPELLSEYDRTCQENWRHMHGLDPILEPGQSAPPWIAEHWSELLPCLPATGRDLSRLAGGA